MRDAGVGRVLVASLHQAIGDVLPTRLGFYEHWLPADKLCDGTIGLAPLYAVLSFLRQEGPAYETITVRAGQYAAEWTVASMSSGRRAAFRAMPRWLRARMLLRLARQVVRESYRGSRCRSRISRGTARLDVSASIFCSVRQPVGHPLCSFYVAAVTRLSGLLDLGLTARVLACRGTGDPSCVLLIPLARAVTPAEGTAAA